MAFNGTFNIPDYIIDEISADLGVPILTLEDLGLTRDKLINLAVRPGLRLYYSYYPLHLKKEYVVKGYTEIPFPEENVYSVASARVALMQNSSSLSRNPFLNQIILQRTTSYNSYGRTRDGRDPYRTTSSKVQARTESNAYVNLLKTGNWNIDIENRKLVGYSNVQGNLVVTWAKYSYDWSAVRFEHESDVIDICKMYALRFIGNLRSQADGNTSITADGSQFLDRASTIEDNILTEKWKARIPLIVMH